MKIDFTNGIIINTGNFTIHDDIFINMSFENKIDTGIMKLNMLKYDNTDCKYCIHFINVLGYEGTSCSFWGQSSRILGFEYIEPDKRILLPKLYEMRKPPIDEFECKLLTDKDYLETIVHFISGDKLTIVCEYIEIDDNTWNDHKVKCR